MSDLWHALVGRLIPWLYFSRITLLNAHRLPKSGPVLYLGLHRNGAVDGFVYARALAYPKFLISTQLRRNWFARLFFHGIAVSRRKDESDRSQNELALQNCVSVLRNGGRLFVFPEGTSSLGPHHLPFKVGAVFLILEYLKTAAPPLQIIPVGIHYECAWAFRDRVEVVLGEPISTELPADASPLDRVKILKRRVQAALESVGINVISNEVQERIEGLAYVSTLGTERSYFRSLKALEQSTPAVLERELAGLKAATRTRGLLRHHGVPLVPTRSPWLYTLAWVIFAPVTAVAIILNALPVAGAWLAGKKLADEANVVSLWKVLAGLPLFGLWMSAMAIAATLYGRWMWFATYLVITGLGLRFYYHAKKLTVAVYNSVRSPGVKTRLLALHQRLLESLPNEAA